MLKRPKGKLSEEMAAYVTVLESVAKRYDLESTAAIMYVVQKNNLDKAVAYLAKIDVDNKKKKKDYNFDENFKQLRLGVESSNYLFEQLEELKAKTTDKKIKEVEDKFIKSNCSVEQMLEIISQDV